MKSHELPIKSRQNKQRVGRGKGSGHGKTAGRGMDGQNSRSGGRVRPGFEGGQNPFSKRIPKTRGFRRMYSSTNEIYTDQLNRFQADTTIDRSTLIEAGLLPARTRRVKLIKRGELNVPLRIELDSLSAGAREAVEQAGGSVATQRT